MVVNSLLDIAVHSILEVGVLLLCNWLLFFAVQKLITCGYINRWVVLLLHAAYIPVICMLWTVGIFSIYYQLRYHESFDLIIYNIEQLQWFFLALAFSWFLFRLKNIVIKEFLEIGRQGLSKYDPILIVIVSKVTTVCILFLSAAMIFQIFGIPLQTFALFQGAFSIALGLAAQNILGNFLEV